MRDQDILRFLISEDFNFKKTYQAFETYFRWALENIPPVLLDQTEKIIRSGFVYLHGRDKHFRPLCVIET